jgi:tRNA A37 threonylcarbamoyladenosine synthetase subunit TsaC/SUA5/YrdC
VAAWSPDIDAVLDGGKTPGGMPSTLVDLTTWPPRCIREGAVHFQTILESI